MSGTFISNKSSQLYLYLSEFLTTNVTNKTFSLYFNGHFPIDFGQIDICPCDLVNFKCPREFSGTDNLCVRYYLTNFIK